MGLRRWRDVAVITAMLSMVAANFSGPAPAVASMGPRVAAAGEEPLSEAAKAAGKAKATGTRVEIMGQRDEVTEVFANPDGTFTSEMHARPVRVKRPDGSWVPIDTTLRRKASGVVAPVASPTPLRLSGGGDGPLVSLFHEGKSLSLTWPDRLPAPVLKGDTATYPEVLPGVDLAVRAYEDGFAEALVVKTATAARNPSLATIRLKIAVAGVTLRPGPGGSFAAVDQTGREVFGSGTPTMWDSSTHAHGTVDAVEERSADRLSGPASGARRSELSVRFSGDQLELTTDRAMLTDPGTAFPVYIDPSVTVSQSYWTMINARFPTQSYWSYDRSDGAKVGYVEDYGASWVKYRSLFRFPTSSFIGKHVYSAQFSATLYHSYYCTKTRADLYHITTGFSSSTNWNNSTPWSSGNYLANASGQSCSSSGDVRMEWGSSALTARTDTASGTNLILGLKAYDESAINKGWKKFKPSTAKLSVSYNTPPNPPTQITINGHGCAQGADRPVIGSTSPKITAYLYDADTADRIDVRMYYTPLGDSNSVTNSVLRENLANRSTLVIDEGAIPSGALVDGGTYFIQGYARDTSPVADRSPDSARCEFTVDTSRPENIPTVTSADYPDDGAFHGGVGITGQFTFSPNEVADVATYQYWLDGQPVATVAANADGTAMVKVTPQARGGNKLYVRSKDGAGNISDLKQDYIFYVRTASGPVAHWSMSEESGTALVDSSGNGNDATLRGTTTRTSGRVGVGRDRAVNFDGSTGEAWTSSSPVDTSKSFAAAAWVRLTRKDSDRVAVSFNGPDGNVYRLYYSVSLDRWAFSMTGSVTVRSSAAPRLGVWTHLAATADEATGRLSLYVNGALQASAVSLGLPGSFGSPVVGRGQSGLHHTHYFAGDIDEIQIWGRMAYQPEFDAIVKQATLVGQWLFEDDADSVVAGDTSGYSHPAQMTSLTSWGAGRDGTQGMTSTGGWAYTSGPVLITDQSLTISAWVRLTDTANWRTAVSQAGAHSAGFSLQYEYASRKWGFIAASSDVDGATPHRATSTSAPTNQWTHLVGVYDMTAQELRIYVNGNFEGKIAHTAWHATGHLHLGVSLWDTNHGDAWRGDLDEVRVFTGVLSDQQIKEMYEFF